MMTSENYSTPRKYKVEKADGRLYHTESERKDTTSYFDDHGLNPNDTTDLGNTESVDVESPSTSNGRRCRGRRNKDHVSESSPRYSDDMPVEGATAQVLDKSKSLKKEKHSGSTSKKRKERKNLREKRRSTGVVIMPGAANDEQADEARQTLQNTQQNENIGTEDFSPSPSEVSPSNSASSSRIAHDDVDLDRRDKQDLIARLEQLEKNLEMRNKEVETLKSDNQRLRDENNALLRVVNQLSSLKTK